MKNLQKIPLKIEAKFCWQWKPAPSGVPYAKEYVEEEKQKEHLRLQEDVDNSVEKNQEAVAKRNYQQQINKMLEFLEAPDLKEKPKNFEKIPVSEFLKRSAEELRTLFIDNGEVNFRGNHSAYEVLGLSDLFPKTSDQQQFITLDGETYAYGARRKDGKIGYGNPKYKAIKGGEKIEFFIGPSKTDENGKSRENFQSFIQDKENKQIPPKYDELSKKFAGFSEQLENLSVDEANTEREKFLETQKIRDNREKIARQKEAELGLTETMNFKEKMVVIAKSVGKSYNLPWEVIYAQSALETGNGKHVPYNNYFGIKSSKDWDGPSTEDLATSEDFGNGLENISAKFRGYSSMFDSAIGYAKFIEKYDRYESARENFKTGGTPFMYLVGIKQAGYATDPNYVFKVNNIFKSQFGYDIPGKN